MGLDNIRNYACKEKGSAALVVVTGEDDEPIVEKTARSSNG